MPDLTDQELNEAMALEVLGWTRCDRVAGRWDGPNEGHYAGDPDWAWATSVDACLDDLSPVVKQVWPEGRWSFSEAHGVWVVLFYCEYRNRQWKTFSATAPTLARAICLVALAVVKAHQEED